MSSDPNSAPLPADVQAASSVSAARELAVQEAPPQSEVSAEQTGKDAASDEVAGDGGESQKPRIKIGTQRPGVAVPRVEPRAKVVFQTVAPDGPNVAQTIGALLASGSTAVLRE